MTQKPKIQYVGMFYNHGSEARKLKEKTSVRQTLAQKIQYRPQSQILYLDPVAIVAIAVAVVMLVAMIVGGVRLQQDWASYERMHSYVSDLKAENAALEQSLRESYDLDDIAEKAGAMGLVSMEELSEEDIYVVVPVVEPEMTKTEEMKWFLEGLFAA